MKNGHIAIAAAAAILGTEKHVATEFGPGGALSATRAPDPSYRDFFLEPGGNVIDHCERAIHALLSTAYVKTEEIDTVLLGSDLVIDLGRHQIRQRLVQMQRNTGLQAAYLMPIFLSECSNFAAALEIARGLIFTGSARRILILSSETRGRAMLSLNSGSLISDSAVAALVEPDAGIGLKVETLMRTSDHDLCLIRGGEPNELSIPLSVLKFARRVGKTWEVELQQALQAQAHVIYPNLPNATKLLWARELGLPLEINSQIDTMAEVAHAGPADPFMCLTKGLANGYFASGDRVITLHPGSHVWNMAVMKLGDMSNFVGYDSFSRQVDQTFAVS